MPYIKSFLIFMLYVQKKCITKVAENVRMGVKPPADELELIDVKFAYIVDGIKEEIAI